MELARAGLQIVYRADKDGVMPIKRHRYSPRRGTTTHLDEVINLVEVRQEIARRLRQILLRALGLAVQL
jgi:hypothetical protein